MALTAQYLNFRQRKLGTNKIQTVHIRQHESADTGSLPIEDFFKYNPNYFQVSLPGTGSNTVIHLRSLVRINYTPIFIFVTKLQENLLLLRSDMHTLICALAAFSVKMSGAGM